MLNHWACRPTAQYGTTVLRNYISLYIYDILDRENYKHSYFSFHKSCHKSCHVSRKIGQRLTYIHGNFALVYGGIDEGIHFGASQPKDTCLETEEYIHVPHIYGYKWSHSTVIHFMQGHKKTCLRRDSADGAVVMLITPFLPH